MSGGPHFGCRSDRCGVSCACTQTDALERLRESGSRYCVAPDALNPGVRRAPFPTSPGLNLRSAIWRSFSNRTLCSFRVSGAIRSAEGGRHQFHRLRMRSPSHLRAAAGRPARGSDVRSVRSFLAVPFARSGSEPTSTLAQQTGNVASSINRPSVRAATQTVFAPAAAAARSETQVHSVRFR